MASAGLCVVDASAWIEWLTGCAASKPLARLMPTRALCVVPTIVQLELAKWLAREVGEDEADRRIGYTQQCTVVPLNTGLALQAAKWHRRHKLATADAIVYATAQQAQARLLTCDAHVDGLADVVYVAKAS